MNDCTSQLITNQRLENEAPKNRYNNGLCNVGTNFKTGVNIKKENHSFIIILPPRATRMWFKNMYGIFSSGIISIIQALARQRTKGEIHIILPRPDEFDISSLKKANINDLQIRVFEDFYSKVKHHTLDEEEKKVQYLPLTVQDNLLYNFYHKDLEGFLKDEIYTIAKKEKNKEREELPRLTFPPYEIWKLQRGEQYLAHTYKFFGDDISAYVTYCAFTNQFINCNLTGINYKSTLLFEEGKMQKKLYTYFDKYFGEDYLEMEHTYSNFSMFYNKLRNEFINNFQLKFKKSGSKEYDNIKPYSNKIFEIQFILFTHKLYQGYNIKEQPQNDIEYSRSQYLLDCISTSNSINLENSEYTEQQTRRIQAFQYLGLLRDRLIQSVSESNNKPKFQYLPLVPPVDFIKPDETKILNDILKIIIEAPLFKNDIFSLRRNFERKSNLESKIKSLYKILVDDFFKVEDFTNYPQVVINGKRRNVKPIIEPIMLPRADTAINLVMLSDFDQDFIKMIEEYILQIPKSKSDTSPKYKDSEEYYSEISKLLE